MNTNQLCPKCKESSVLVPITGNRWDSYHSRAEIALDCIEEGTIDAVITDPPYGSGGTTVAKRLRPSSEKYQSSDRKEKLPDIDGDAMLPEAWIRMMTTIFDKVRRACKPGADLLVFCDWMSLTRFIEVIGAAGLYVRSVGIWDKGRCSRPNRNGMRNQVEMILHARRSGKVEREKDIYLNGVFQYPTMRNNKLHLTQKPLELMHELMQLAPPEGIVLDPFQGSGTTGVAALQTNRRYIGIESVKHYHDIAIQRLQEFSTP
ncbi:DNA-methyltransferase [Aureliella helgolandensis]|uniref:Methyltransferase n=1 Tax=Aureliella helgolandensis TaxID=2527968 RepID=A0A518G4Q3_9BACT|nr:site-specific DNA-methyltransferase [Aureliella helgolandensis]QDV23576.1 Modification methylase DpnIIB [Aureliella helgolandensis]